MIELGLEGWRAIAIVEFVLIALILLRQRIKHGLMKLIGALLGAVIGAFGLVLAEVFD